LRTQALFALLKLYVAIFASSAVADIFVRVRPHVFAPADSEVKLSQLVESQGLSSEFQSKLESIAVSVAPADGERQSIHDVTITPLLRPLIQKERLRFKESIHLVVPKVISVTTSRGDINVEFVRDELMQAWKSLCVGCQLEVTGLSVPRLTQVRDWSLNLKSDLPRGGFSLPVNVIKEDGSSSVGWVSGTLKIKRKVPVATRILAMNERVSIKDFNWEYRDTSYAIDGIPTAEDLAGRKLRQGLRVSDILWKSMLERERAVRRGDMVQIRSASGAWEVTMNAVAQEDGFVGDVINLKNAKSNAVLMGQVTGQGEVDLR